MTITRDEETGRVLVTINANTEGFTRAMSRASRGLHRLGVNFLSSADKRQHIRHCPWCNTAGYPKPLRIDGHEYRRRRTNRRRR